MDGKERDNVREEVLKLTGDLRFPTIVIGKKVIVGFYEDKLKEALGYENCC